MITNKVEYLLLTLVDLAARRDGEYVASREVAARQGIPLKYIPQIVSVLSKKGWVDSMRGPKGGIRLAVDPESVTVQDVIDTSGDPFLVKPCLGPDTFCSRMASCPLRGVWMKAQEQVANVMRGVTLADLVMRLGEASKENP
ncbi:MAG TPA: Rrf2 family transcriptional regulator [Firmicutes bacterium]|nr:Rrf2 family transcriptional regulator [Candidatus Fermentithermobacillaceae bacterium]